MYFRCIVLCLVLGMAIRTTSALKTEIQIRVNEEKMGEPFEAEITEVDSTGSIKNVTNENLAITEVEIDGRQKSYKALRKLVDSGKVKVVFTYNGTKNEALVFEIEGGTNHISFTVNFQFEVLPYPKISVSLNGSPELDGFFIAARSQLLFQKEYSECSDFLKSGIWDIKGDGVPTTVQFLGPPEETNDCAATLIKIRRLQQVNIQLDSALRGYLSLCEMAIELCLTEDEAIMMQEKFKQVNYWNYYFDGLPHETYRIVPTSIGECFRNDKTEGYVYFTVNFTPVVSKEEVSIRSIYKKYLAKQKVEVILYADEGRLYGFVCKDNTVEIYVNSNEKARFRELIKGNLIWTYRNAAGKLTKIYIPFRVDYTFIKSKLHNYEYVELDFIPTIIVKTAEGVSYIGIQGDAANKVRILGNKVDLQKCLESLKLTPNLTVTSPEGKETIMKKVFSEDKEPFFVPGNLYCIQIESK